jgi:copper binding plastocyanin/azurin family protein
MKLTTNHSTPAAELPERAALRPAPATTPHRHLRALTTVMLLALLAVASCSKNGYSPPTAPGGGGNNGGGGGGTPLHLGPFATGQSASFTFASAGIFGYHCIPHRAMGMVGEVLVDDAGADSALVQIGAGGFSFAPGTAHIKPGGHVRWVNVSNLTNHTVTSN